MMKKSALQNMKPRVTEAEYVVAHAEWQKSRGRKPSEGFEGERNPIKALALAKKVLREQTIDTVTFVEHPGVVCHRRNLAWVRQANERLGRTLLSETYEYSLAAVIETDRTGEINGIPGDPLVIDYWDYHGRVAMTRFIGNRGAEGTRGMTNLYAFDSNGRLAAFWQIMHNADGSDTAFRGCRYEYPPGRPNDQYTLIRFRVGKDKEVIPFEERKRG